jgi:hypothetical protein
MTQQEKLEEALRSLVEMCVRDRLNIEFRPPEEDPQTTFGQFTAARFTIEIYKERTELLNIFHVYSFAHEYRHFQQYCKLEGYNSWLYAIGYTHKDNRQQAAEQEIDADDFAIKFLKQHGIRITKKLKQFVADRMSFYEEER